MSFIIDDCIEIIFNFIKDKKDWKSIRLTCKRFLKLHSKNFDHSFDKNWLLYWCIRNERNDLLKKVLSDSRVLIDNSDILNLIIDFENMEAMEIFLEDGRLDPFEQTRKTSALSLAVYYDDLIIYDMMIKDKRFKAYENDLETFGYDLRYDISPNILWKIMTTFKIELSKYTVEKLSKRLCLHGDVSYLRQWKQAGFPFIFFESMIYRTYRAEKREMTQYLLITEKFHWELNRFALIAWNKDDEEMVNFAVKHGADRSLLPKKIPANL